VRSRVAPSCVADKSNIQYRVALARLSKKSSVVGGPHACGAWVPGWWWWWWWWCSERVLERDARGVQPRVRARSGALVTESHWVDMKGREEYTVHASKWSLVMFRSGEGASPFLPLWHVPCPSPSHAAKLKDPIRTAALRLDRQHSRRERGRMLASPSVLDLCALLGAAVQPPLRSAASLEHRIAK
jgi:hypothetical protein